MWHEWPYRLALAVILVVTMSIGIYRRRQAARSGERFDRRQEGTLLAIALRVSGLVVWLATFAYLVWPAAIAWAAVPLPAWLRWSGAVFGIAGMGLMYATLAHLGKNLTDTVATRTAATLVTGGPYRWVRHPFYVTAATLMLAAGLLSANLLIAGAGLAVIALLVLRTPTEEQKLIEKFGDAYREYMARTGRFLPRIGS